MPTVKEGLLAGSLGEGWAGLGFQWDEGREQNETSKMWGRDKDNSHPLGPGKMLQIFHVGGTVIFHVGETGHRICSVSIQQRPNHT